MAKIERLERPIWTACLDEIARCAVKVQKEEDKNEKVKTILNVFAKHDVKVLASLVEERQKDQGCAPSL